MRRHNFEIVDSFTYLGVFLLLKESIIAQTKKHVIEQSRKASYCLHR